MPRMTTQVRRMSVTAPAPRVAYQRTVLDTAQREAPLTAWPPLDEELTPLEGCRVFEMLEDVDEVDESDESDEVDESEVLDELDAVVPFDDVEEEVVPGIVSALTALNTPTPAKAASAAPTVNRSSRRRAASRACTRRSVTWVRSMGESMGLVALPNVGNS